MPFTDSLKIVEVLMLDDEEKSLTTTPEDVVIGKTFIGQTKEYETGSLPVLPEVSGNIILESGSSYRVGYGKVPKAFTILAEGIGPQTPGTATVEDVLNGKTAWVNGEKITGTMVDNGSVHAELAAGQSYRVPAGYHSGFGLINTLTLAQQTAATAIKSDIIDGQTAWVNGEMIVGEMPIIGAQKATLNCGEFVTLDAGYHNGAGLIEAASLSSQTLGSATSENITEGFVAWVNGERITGTMPLNNSQEIVLPLNGEYYIPLGYHTGNGKVIQNIPFMDGQTIGPTRDPQIVETAGKCLTGNIVVTGVDALNYQRNVGPVKDIIGDEISDYVLTVADGQAQVKVFVDNWHDNATFNLYRLTFADLKNTSGNDINLTCLISIDWADQTQHTYTFGDITISIELAEETNAHLFTISGISSGKLNMYEIFSARQFG